MMKILGLYLDSRLRFGYHVEQVINKAKIRQELLRRVAGFTWGLEANVLRMTVTTLIISLLRYGLALYGAMAYEQSLYRLDATVVNVAARKVLGVSMSARLPALHATAGLKSARNLLQQHSAEMLDSTLRVTNSTAQDRLKTWSRKAYKVWNWGPKQKNCAWRRNCGPLVAQRALQPVRAKLNGCSVCWAKSRWPPENSKSDPPSSQMRKKLKRNQL